MPEDERIITTFDSFKDNPFVPPEDTPPIIRQGTALGKIFQRNLAQDDLVVEQPRSVQANMALDEATGAIRFKPHSLAEDGPMDDFPVVSLDEAEKIVALEEIAGNPPCPQLSTVRKHGASKACWDAEPNADPSAKIEKPEDSFFLKPGS